jgi:nitrite reductase/ring-hydroxylating ferredoxin subunit
MALVKIAEATEMSEGTGRVVQAGEKTLALFNIGGTFYAIENRCTHVGGPLGEGRLSGSVVTCPWHGSRFDVTTGQVVGPPARRPVQAYPTRVQDGAVFVEIP